MSNENHKYGSFYDSVCLGGKSFIFKAYRLLPQIERHSYKELAVSLAISLNKKRAKQMQEKLGPVFELYHTRRQGLFMRQTGLTKSIGSDLASLLKEEKESVNKVRKSFGQELPSATVVADIFYVWEKMVETDWERFERLLYEHDWNSSCLDEYDVETVWQRRHDEILLLKDKLGSKAEQTYQAFSSHSRIANRLGKNSR